MFRGPIGAVALIVVFALVASMIYERQTTHKGCASIDATIRAGVY
jgi:hypothetical protein